MEISFISHSEQETLRYGGLLGEMVLPGSVIGLFGDLGAGKTCFVKGLAYGINRIPEAEVTSPTFTILQEYEGIIPLYHFDAYRLSGSDDLEAIGFEDYTSSQGVSIIEWADRIADALPEECLRISIDYIGESQRRFTCTAEGGKYCAILDKFHEKIETL
ncbi:MAG: tRNA (adenosine(37)-N6)-threonylcarbamoyltransferase complex ATPase subunit type 1 TsaE [Pseudomonadota bacterium]